MFSKIQYNILDPRLKFWMHWPLNAFYLKAYAFYQSMCGKHWKVFQIKHRYIWIFCLQSHIDQKKLISGKCLEHRSISWRSAYWLHFKCLDCQICYWYSLFLDCYSNYGVHFQSHNHHDCSCSFLNCGNICIHSYFCHYLSFIIHSFHISSNIPTNYNWNYFKFHLCFIVLNIKGRVKKNFYSISNGSFVFGPSSKEICNQPIEIRALNNMKQILTAGAVLGTLDWLIH